MYNSIHLSDGSLIERELTDWVGQLVRLVNCPPVDTEDWEATTQFHRSNANEKMINEVMKSKDLNY